MLDNGIPADPVVREYIQDYYLAFDPRDQARVDALQPDFRLNLGRVVNDLRSQGFQPRVYDTIRTVAQQRANVASGASQTMNSLHLTGRAADLADARTWFSLGSRDPFLHALGRSATAHGMVWGGNWTTLVDMYHVQAR